MLTKLYIRNFAIISELDISFSGNLNILTGETGAGKSILLGAVSLILGERASSDMIRYGEERALVEAVFKLSPASVIDTVLAGHDLDKSGEFLTIRREITAKGQNRIFINDQSATLAALKSLGELLVDLHGQHDHQSLLNPEKQLDFLDEFCNHTGLLKETARLWAEAEHKRKSLNQLEKQRDLILEKRELFEFQLKEIRQADPKEGEDIELEQELTVLENAEFLFQTSGAVGYSLTGAEEGNLVRLLTEVRKKIEDLHQIDKSLADYVKEFDSALISIRETGRFFENYAGKVVIDPERLVLVKSRLDELNRLKKKYGPSLTEVRARAEQLENELAGGLNVDENLNRMKSEFSELQAAYRKQAEQLSSSRKQKAVRLAVMVKDHLKELGLEKASFSVQFGTVPMPGSWVLSAGAPVEAGESGFDSVSFMISANTGEPEKPLARVASGGEISRIMLAIKASTATVGGIGVLIFDEIDTGVSGKTAFSVGKLLTRLANDRQVFVITHLPQVASVPGDHFMVSKRVSAGSTESTVRLLTESSRVEEIAKLLSGDTITELSRTQAKELLTTPR